MQVTGRGRAAGGRSCSGQAASGGGGRGQAASGRGGGVREHAVSVG